MGKLENLEAKAVALKGASSELINAVEAVDAKLDEVREFIEGLEAGADQAALDRIDALLNDTQTIIEQGKEKSAAVFAEADALDMPPEAPAPQLDPVVDPIPSPEPDPQG